MKIILSWFVLIVSIAVLVSSCAKSKSSSTATATTTTTSVPGIFVVVGTSGTIVRSTDNGASFDNVTSGLPGTSDYNILGIGFGNDTFIAVGKGGNIVRSTDNGSSWDNATSGTTKNLFGVGFSE